MIQTTGQQKTVSSTEEFSGRSPGIGLDPVHSSPLPDPGDWHLLPDLISADQIHAVNPQRFEMHQLDGILSIDDDRQEILGYRHLADNPFASEINAKTVGQGTIQAGPRWTEVAAQVSAYYLKRLDFGGMGINFGIGGIYGLEFHHAALTGHRLYVLSRAVSVDAPVSARMEFEGYVDSTPFFSGEILLMPLKCLDRSAGRSV